MGDILNSAKLMRREVTSSEFIPYTVPVTREIVKTVAGDYCQVFKVKGIAHETADPSQVFAWHNSLSGLLKNIASPKLALWTHLVRRPFFEYPGGEFLPGFAHDLNEKYRAKFDGETMYINELYISLVYRPTNMARKLTDLLGGVSEEDQENRLQDDIAACRNLAGAVKAGLDRYGPSQLTWYTHTNGMLCSEQEEFLAYLLNLRWQRRSVSRQPIRNTLAWTRPFFAKGGAIPVMGPTHTDWAAMLGIAEYTPKTLPGLVNQLLSCPFPLILAQSFTFTSREVAKEQIKLQGRRMDNAEDDAVSLREELDEGLDDVASGRVVNGAHHFSLLVHGETQKAVNEALNVAGTIMSDAGMKWAREDLASQAAFYAQLPGNFNHRPRVAPISSRNFAGFSSLHNFPIGRIRGAQWGDAVTVFKTTSGAPYYFNWHKPLEANEGSKSDPNHKELANTLIIGKSGVGKTLLQAFLLSQSMKFGTEYHRTGNPSKRLSFAMLDKDLGNSLIIPNLGGRYYRIKGGQPTGWAPLQLPDTPELRQFCQTLIEKLVEAPQRPLSTVDKASIFNAIAGVIEGPAERRTFSSLLEYLDPTDPEGVAARLKKWCVGGQYGWLFDNPVNTLDLANVAGVGFDVTYFLPIEELRTPATMFLLHVINDFIDGRRVPIFIEEAGILLKDPVFRDLAENKLVTIRKQNGFLVLLGQTAKQFTGNPIADALVQGTANKIFLPNPEAKRQEHVDGMSLTGAEFEIIKNLGEKSRQFLIKQGDSSVVAELNLAGFDDELAVLSVNTYTAGLIEQLIEEYGEDPAAWMSEFHRRRKESA
ncbi:VirB4 family type IV secretion/conjugal transfer ATPase [Achromobacter spanius]|uniref:VirB4 family type IV secretion/conjugal transfer ATPase n=1 Tax=Achromobacter spanius TaxID=217203 RepID=UPI00380D74B5